MEESLSGEHPRFCDRVLAFRDPGRGKAFETEARIHRAEIEEAEVSAPDPSRRHFLEGDRRELCRRASTRPNEV